MPGRLPVELLRLVLEQVARLDGSVNAYAVRQATLMRCCLVSKLVRAVAQPLLNEVMLALFAEDLPFVKRTLEAVPSFAAEVRILRGMITPSRYFLHVALRFSKATDLAIEGDLEEEEEGEEEDENPLEYPEVNLAEIVSALPHLKHLSLADLTVLLEFSPAAAPVPTISLSIKSICLYHATIDPSLVKRILDPQATPSLRAVRVARLRDATDDDLDFFFPDLECLHLERLDFLHLDHDALLPQVNLGQLGPIVLLNVALDRTLSYDPLLVRLVDLHPRHIQFVAADRRDEALSPLAISSSLRTLHRFTDLLPHLHDLLTLNFPTDTGPWHDDGEGQAFWPIGPIEDLCRASGVALNWDDAVFKDIHSALNRTLEPWLREAEVDDEGESEGHLVAAGAV
ncbi:hypothetical protein JCM8097_005322 [Rhodosporidiobolus ruineniae]